MRIFITVTFKGDKNRKEIKKLCLLVKKAGFEDFCFVKDIENFQKRFNDPSELMSRVKQEIKNSDALLIDLTDKSTGRAIEAGIAYSLGKTIIAIAKRGTKIKDTSRGIADLLIEYDDLNEITIPLKKFLDSI